MSQTEKLSDRMRQTVPIYPAKFFDTVRGEWATEAAALEEAIARLDELNNERIRTLTALPGVNFSAPFTPRTMYEDLSSHLAAQRDEIAGLHENQSDLYIKLGGEDETLSPAMEWHACVKMIGELRDSSSSGYVAMGKHLERTDSLRAEIGELRRENIRMGAILSQYDAPESGSEQADIETRAIDAAMQAEQAKEEGAHFAKQDSEREKRRRDGESTNAR